MLWSISGNCRGAARRYRPLAGMKGNPPYNLKRQGYEGKWNHDTSAAPG